MGPLPNLGPLFAFALIGFLLSAAGAVVVVGGVGYVLLLGLKALIG